MIIPANIEDPSLRYLAKSFGLKEHPCPATRATPNLVTADDLIWPDERRPRKPRKVWTVRSMDEVRHTNQEIVQSKRDNWNFFNDGIPLRSGIPLVLYVSRGDQPEGVLASTRRTNIFTDEIAYSLYMDLIYVTSKARKRMLSTALKVALVNIVFDDIERIVKAAKRRRLTLPITIYVEADIYSEGGERAVNDVYQMIECLAEAYNYPVTMSAQWGW